MAIVFVFSIIGGVFFKRAFDALGEKSGVQTFKTAGLISLIGYALSIVLVGGILVWVAWIMLASAFHSLKPAAPAASSYSQPSASSFVVQKRYCPYCGAGNILDAKFCDHCGKQL
jgi:ribosomal protein S27AE